MTLLTEPTRIVLAKTSVAPQLIDAYSGAAAAYSLRGLSLAYGGPVIRVRRGSDNTEQDFTAIQVTNGTLSTFCGAGDGFVRTWYDQSGNGRHLQQATTASQLSIVTSGILESDGGLPAIRSISGYKTLSVSWRIAPTDPVLFLVHKSTGSPAGGFSGHWVDIGNFTTFNNHLVGGVYSDYFSAARPLYGNTTVPQLNTRYLEQFKYSGGSGTVKLNNTAIGSVSFNLATPENLLLGGDVAATGNFPATGFIQELIIYSTGTGVDAAGAQSNINAYYAIY